MVLSQSFARPDFIIDAGALFGVTDAASHHEWVLGGQGRRALARGVLPANVGTPDDPDASATPAAARIDTGRWLADCPSPICNAAMDLRPQQGEFMCGDCYNSDVPQRRYRLVVWPVPKEREEVERLLLERPDQTFMNWRPGVRAATLHAENRRGAFHHSWTAPKTYTVGSLGTASDRNTYERDNLLETAPAKATAAGIVVATAANVLALLAAAGNGSKVLRVNAGATAMELASLASAGITWRGGSTAATSTTSTSAVDLMTISELSIPVTSPVLLHFVVRKQALGAARADFGIKVNSAVIWEAGELNTFPSSATDRAEDGSYVVIIPPRSANYLRGAIAFGGWRESAGGTNATTFAFRPTQPNAALPNATITSIALRALNTPSSVAAEVKEIHAYELATAA